MGNLDYLCQIAIDENNEIHFDDLSIEQTKEILECFYDEYKENLIDESFDNTDLADIFENLIKYKSYKINEDECFNNIFDIFKARLEHCARPIINDIFADLRQPEKMTPGQNPDIEPSCYERG